MHMLDGLDLMIDGDDANEGDVYFQLAQKEKYLLIAAEAGNTLLKKNNELQTKLNCMEKEYCNQIDVLKKEQYLQKKYFQEKSADYEAEIHNLTLDIRYLNEKISKIERKSFLNGEKQDNDFKDVIEQNEELQNQLNQVTVYNKELSFQVNTLKRRIEGRASANDMSPDEFQYDIMEPKMTIEQIRQLQQEKKDLEEAVSQFASEKILLFQDIEKSKNYIASLEQQVKDFQQQMKIAESDLSAAKMSNSQLKDQLEEYILQASFTSFHNNNSLMNELETSFSEYGQNFHDKNVHHSEDDFQPDIRSSSSPKLKTKSMGEKFPASQETDNQMFTRNNGPSTENSNNQCEKSDSVKKWDVAVLNQQILEVNRKLNMTVKDFEKLTKQSDTRKRHLEEAERKVQSLQQQVMHQERELEILKREREIIFCDSVPEALKKALNDRSDALQRESMALSQLEQAKLDMIKLNSQLLEAVEQKLRLSEQLEMWQADMATLLERQLNRKTGRDRSRGPGKASKIFSGRWSWSSNSKSSQPLFRTDNNPSP